MRLYIFNDILIKTVKNRRRSRTSRRLFIAWFCSRKMRLVTFSFETTHLQKAPLLFLSFCRRRIHRKRSINVEKYTRSFRHLRTVQSSRKSDFRIVKHVYAYKWMPSKKAVYSAEDKRSTITDLGVLLRKKKEKKNRTRFRYFSFSLWIGKVEFQRETCPSFH